MRMDGVKVRVFEVMGLELDEPKLGAFAGALNAMDFPVQLLVRQHPPDLASLRTLLENAQPNDLPPRTKGGCRVPAGPADEHGDPGRHSGPALLRRLPDGARR